MGLQNVRAEAIRRNDNAYNTKMARRQKAFEKRLKSCHKATRDQCSSRDAANQQKERRRKRNDWKKGAGELWMGPIVEVSADHTDTYRDFRPKRSALGSVTGWVSGNKYAI